MPEKTAVAHYLLDARRGNFKYHMEFSFFVTDITVNLDDISNYMRIHNGYGEFRTWNRLMS